MRILAPIVTLLAATTLFSQAADRPNVVVFLSDDQGWGDLSISGNLDLETPNIDSIAQQGVSFQHFYVSPVCSPTRAEFLTGRHHARTGVYSTSSGGERMNTDETTIADLFKDAGYATGAFGKWHNGTQAPYHPNSRGFEEFYGFCSGHWGNYFDPMLEHNGRIVKGDGFCIDDFTNKAMAFIKKSVKKDQPFFAYLPYNTPHSPMQVPNAYWQKFKNKEFKSLNPQQSPDKVTDHQRCALAMCENLDWNVGRMLKHLKKLGIEDNTIVVWFHDNGPNGGRWNGGMRGVKGSTDEGGVRSPLFIRWPNTIAAGKTIDPIASARDLLPTLCGLSRIDTTTLNAIDGISLTPLVKNSKYTDWPQRVLINQWGKRISARSQQYRLDHKGNLYDMQHDPGQQSPVNAKHPDVLAKLSQAVATHRELVGTAARTDRPFPVGHSSLKITQLPARDATPHGKLKRSSRHPNCSYLANWTQTSDHITFDIDVQTSGRYQATIYYATKDADALMELNFKESSLAFQIPKAHDVQEHGAERDHHKRSESYVKDFKPLTIGSLPLEKGRGTLSLKALKIPGEEAIEFRLLTLEHVED